MGSKLYDYWNQDTKRIPLDKDKSQFAVDMEKLFPRNSSVCDLGGGKGADTLYFLQKGHRITLLDISDNALNDARERMEKNGFSDRFETKQIDLSEGKIPEENDEFDIVYSRLALHYFKGATLQNIYKEIYRILKPGGTAFIGVKSAKDEKEMEFLRKKTKELEPGVFEEEGITKVRYTEKELREVLENAGINNFQISDYNEISVGKKDVVKSGNTELLMTEIVIKK